MARGRKPRNGAAQDQSIPGTVKATGDELSDEQRQALWHQHRKKYAALVAAKKAADAAVKNHAKLVKAELGEHAIAEFKTADALEADGGEEALQAEIERKLRIARWMGAAIGSQFSLFPDREPLADKAYEDGKRAALKGEPCRPPHPEASEQGQRWIQGHHDATAAIAGKTREELAAAGDLPDLATSVKTGFSQRMRQQNERVDRELRNGSQASVEPPPAAA